MQGIEKTLRDTLSRLDDPTPESRQKLYLATQTILERSLAAFSESQPEMVAKRRAELKDIIAKIEVDYEVNQSATPPEVIVPERPDFSQNPSPDLDIRSGQSMRVDPPSAPQVEPVSEVGASTVAPEIKLDMPAVPNRQGEPVAPEVEPINAESVQPAGPAHTDPTELISAPDINTAPNATRRSNVEWPDAATHPDNLSTSEQEISDPVSEPVGDIEDEVNISDEVQAVDQKTARRDLKARKRADRAQRKQMRSEKRRRGGILDLIASSIVSVILIAFLVVGAWYFVESEYYEMFLDWQNGGDASQVATSENANDQDFIPKPLNEETEQVGDWFELFGYANLGEVQGRGEVLVEAIGDSEVGAVRITSVNSSEFGEAVIPLDRQRLSGAEAKKLALSFSMAVEEPTQIYIRCFLKNGVEVDRRRFQLNGGQNELIVNLDMSDVQQFDQRPFVTINSDIVGLGRSVELYEIKYQVVE